MSSVVICIDFGDFAGAERGRGDGDLDFQYTNRVQHANQHNK
jgi:hypothetical protein